MNDINIHHFITYYTSPIGLLQLIANENGLVALLWEKDHPARVPVPKVLIEKENHILLHIKTQLNEYFSGDRVSFDVPMAISGTSFQLSVWNALMVIPFGETRSYGQLAQAIQLPSAARAVGAAIAKNPISIIIPCHRVIGKKGSLTGFAGGIEAKKYLLEKENRWRLF